jgi:hypothetical protein
MRVLPRRVLARSAVVAALGAAALSACGSPGSPAAGTSAGTRAAGTSAVPVAGPVATSSSASASSSASSSSAAPACSTAAWTARPKARRAAATAPLLAVRAGRHACFDRLVLEFRGRVDGYTVRYVAQVRADGSGALVPLAGAGKLQVTVVAPAYDDAGRATYLPRNRARVVDVTGYRALRQVAWAGSFEGYTTLGVGVRRALPFRVAVLPGPGSRSRIVLDVAHDR